MIYTPFKPPPSTVELGVKCPIHATWRHNPTIAHSYLVLNVQLATDSLELGLRMKFTVVLLMDHPVIY